LGLYGYFRIIFAQILGIYGRICILQYQWQAGGYLAGVKINMRIFLIII
jgi:hypothetical protein